MEALSLWSLGWLDGILLTLWLGGMYFVKCWIDNYFERDRQWKD